MTGRPENSIQKLLELNEVAVSGAFQEMESRKPDIHIPTIKYLDVIGQVPLSINAKPSILFSLAST